MSNQKPSSFIEAVSFEYTEDEVPFGHVRANLTLSNRFPILATSLCPIEDGKFLLLGTESGTMHKMSWSGETLLSWSLSGVHSVYRTAQTMINTLTQNKCWISGEQPKRNTLGYIDTGDVSRGTTTTEDDLNEDELKALEEEEREESKIPRRNGSIITRSCWSEHTRLVAAVFEDGSLSVMQTLTYNPPGMGMSRDNKTSSSNEKYQSSTSTTSSSSSSLVSLSGNRMHPILPTDKDNDNNNNNNNNNSQKVAAGRLSATPSTTTTSPVQWKVDVVSRFVDVALLDSNLCMADTINGLDANIANGTFSGDTCTLMAALVAMPLEQLDNHNSTHNRSSDGHGDDDGRMHVVMEKVSYSVLLIRVAVASPLTPSWGGSLSRKVLLDCSCSIALGGSDLVPKSMQGPGIQQLMWLHPPTGPTLVVAVGQHVRLLTVAPSGTSCMVVSSISLSPSPFNSIQSNLNSHHSAPSSPRKRSSSSSDANTLATLTHSPSTPRILFAPSRSHLILMTTTSTTPVTAPVPSVPDTTLTYLIPMYFSAKSTCCPHACGTLLEHGDSGEISSLLFFDNIKNRGLSRASGEQSDSSDNNIANNVIGAGYCRINIPVKLQLQLKHFGLHESRSQSEGSVRSGLLTATNGRYVVCVGVGAIAISASVSALTQTAYEASRTETPTMWLLDRQGHGKWRSMAFPEEMKPQRSLLSPQEPLVQPASPSPLSQLDGSSPLASHSQEKAKGQSSSSSLTWSSLGGCVPRQAKPTPTPALIASEDVGAVDMVVALSLFGSHSVVLITVRGVLSRQRTDGSQRHICGRKHVLEILSREPSRGAPSLQTTQTKHRQIVSLPLLHRSFFLPAQLHPKLFNIIYLSDSPLSTSSFPSSFSFSKEDHTNSHTNTNSNNYRSKSHSLSQSNDASHTDASNVSRSSGLSIVTDLIGDVDLQSAPSRDNEETAATSTARPVRQQSQDSSSFKTPSPRLCVESSCAVLVADGWRHFSCYKITAVLQTTVFSTSSHPHAQPVDYTVSILWEIDLSVVMGPRDLLDLSYPLRDAVLMPVFGSHYHPPSSDTNTKSIDDHSSVSSYNDVQVSLAVLDGMGTVFTIEPPHGKDAITAAEQTAASVQCVGQGCMSMERIDGPQNMPPALRNILLLYPDGDSEAAAMENGTEFCCRMHLSSLRELDIGLIPGPDLNIHGPGSLSPFGCLPSAGSIALHLKSHGLHLPKDAVAAPPKRLLKNGGTADVIRCSLVIHLLDGLVEAVYVGSTPRNPRHDPQTLIKELLQSVRERPDEVECLVRGLEARWRVVAEHSRGACCKSNYALVSSMLFSCDDQLLLEVLSRLGRKLEPSASRHLFPLPSVDKVCLSALKSHDDSSEPFSSSDSPWTQLALLELCLNKDRLHHASRLLTLACERGGGSTNHTAVASSLVIALELLRRSLRDLSLVISGECVDFCLRLETLVKSTNDMADNKTTDVGDWAGGFMTSLTSIVTALTGVPSDMSGAMTGNEKSVSRFLPAGGTSRWEAAIAIEQTLGEGGFARLLQSDGGSSTMLTVAIVCRNLLIDKRFNAAALISMTVLARRGTVEAFTRLITSSFDHPLVGRQVSEKTPDTHPDTFYLMEIIRAFRLQKAVVGQTESLWKRMVSTTALRQHCELEMQQLQLRGFGRHSARGSRSSMEGGGGEVSTPRTQSDAESMDGSSRQVDSGLSYNSRAAWVDPVRQGYSDEKYTQHLPLPRVATSVQFEIDE
eukprot:gene34587-44715_t